MLKALALVALLNAAPDSVRYSGRMGQLEVAPPKLVDAGTVEHVRVGSHRRIPMRSIANYQRERQLEHEEAAAALDEFHSNIAFGDPQ